jgi:hypothetical protein
MWNGNAVMVRAILLAASIVSIGGCEIAAAPGQAAPDAPQARQPGARVQVDAARNRVWFLTREGVFVFDASKPERVAVSLPGWLWAGAPYGCLPDLALGPRGEAVVTSDVLPTLWRIDPDTLVAAVHPLALDADTDKDVGFSGLAYSPQHGAFLAVGFLDGSLWRIDPALTKAQKIPLSVPLREACGIAVRPRGSQPAPGRAADLCVRTPQGGWSVRFASDMRSASVSAAPCDG